MATERVTITGLRELGERIKRIGSEAAAQKICQKAVNAGALVLKKRAIAKAPVAPAPYLVDDGTASKQLVQPRNIQRNIVVKKVSNTPYTATAIVAVRGKRKNGFASRIASLQEFGTVKQGPQPFMRPAFDEGKEEAADRTALRLQEELDKALR